jgi:hypothetical protein
MFCTECHGAPYNGNFGLSRTYNLRYENYSSKITLTDHRLVDDPCHDFCQQARDNVETVAQFIDDNFNKPLDRYEAIINVGRINGSYEPAGWGRKTRRALFGQREINGRNLSYGTDITVVAHEFCHGLIQQIEEGDNEFTEKKHLKNLFVIYLRF